MSEENVAAVRAVYEEFARGDFGAWAELPDDFVFVASPELPDAGTYRGDAAVRWMTAWVESFEGHTIEATEIIDAGRDKVFVAILQRGRPRGSQTEVEGRWWVVMTLRGGEFVRTEVFPERAQALEAAGLNKDVIGTLQKAIVKINALPAPPDFVLHTGDLSHLSEAEEFDALEQNLKSLKTGEIFYVPGEHDVISDNGALYRERFAKKALGSGWYSFDKKGVHFIGLNNVLNIREGGLGIIGAEQLDWLKKDLEPLSSSTPIVVFAHIPLWAVYP
jgi:3',5'-cyclic AMP phosphodiesterase CpdA